MAFAPKQCRQVVVTDCPEHVWVLTGLTLATDGTHHDYECARCGAVTVVGPDEIAGRSG